MRDKKKQELMVKWHSEKTNIFGPMKPLFKFLITEPSTICTKHLVFNGN